MTIIMNSIMVASIVVLFLLLYVYAFALVSFYRWMDFHKEWAIEWKALELQFRTNQEIIKSVYQQNGFEFPEERYEDESSPQEKAKNEAEHHVEEYIFFGNRIESLTFGLLKPKEDKVTNIPNINLEN